MRGVVLLFSLVCAAVLQTVFPTWFWLGQATPPILLGLCLHYAFHHELPFLMAASVLAGLLQDALGLIPLGYSSFLFCVVALLVSRYRDIIFVGAWLTHALFGALAAGCVTLALVVFLTGADLLVIHPAWAVVKILGAVLLGATIIPLEIQMLEALDRMLGNLEERDV